MLLTFAPISVSAHEIGIVEEGANIDISEVGFSIRTSYPGTSNYYYVPGSAANPFSVNTHGGNCTWYAWGRVYEASGEYPNLPRGNANTWYNSASCAKGSTPRPGAVICGNYGSNGHVAFVEKVYDDGVHFDYTESSWDTRYPNFAYNTYKTTANFSGFQGFLYPFNGNPDPTPDFSPVDIGTDFYAWIVNQSVNKPIKVSNGNVVCGIRDGSNYLKWRFERQGDNSYKIINVATNECLDDDNYGNTDNTNIKACASNDSDAQRWYLRYNGNGYSLIPKCAQNLAMDMVNGDSTEGSNIAAWTFVENNSNQIFAVEFQPSFTPADLGLDFYANITNLPSLKNVSVSGSNVQIATCNGDDWQKWHFERQSDISYKIINVATGNSMDVSNFGTANGTNIQVMPWANNTAQRWYLKPVGNGYSIVPKCALSSCIDISNGDTSHGSNIQLCQQSNNNAQIFSISMQPSFSAINLGRDFTASIIYNESGSAVTIDPSGNVVVRPYDGSLEQQWHFQRMNDRAYKITNASTGKCLDVAGGNSANKTNIGTYNSNDSYAQRWFVRTNGNGYSLAPKCAVNSAMDLDNGIIDNNSNIQIYSYIDNGTHQVFSLNYSLNPIEMKVYNGNTYKLYNTVIPWKEAYKFCEQQGGHLVTINSTDEQSFIHNLVKSTNSRKYTWLGATDIYSEGKWKWITGDSLSYSNWADGEPNNSNDEDYLMLYNETGKWNDSHDIYYDFSDSYSFICEYDSIPILGDVDGDDKVTIIDATCIQRKLASIATAKFIEAAADADEDGSLSIIDATTIQRWLAHLSINDNIGKPIA